MAVSKAQQNAVNKYVRANYDRVNVTLPKGSKETIKAAADREGMSVNAFIVQAITEKLRSGGGSEGDTAPAASALSDC